MGRSVARERGPGAAVPLRVGLVVFVPLVLDHPEAADADVWSGHLHPIQGDPARRGGEEGRKGVLGNVSERPPGNASASKYVVVSMFCALLYLL